MTFGKGLGRRRVETAAETKLRLAFETIARAVSVTDSAATHTVERMHCDAEFRRSVLALAMRMMHCAPQRLSEIQDAADTIRATYGGTL